jgi:hypothetical protein
MGVGVLGKEGEALAAGCDVVFEDSCSPWGWLS